MRVVERFRLLEEGQHLVGVQHVAGHHRRATREPLHRLREKAGAVQPLLRALVEAADELLRALARDPVA